MRHIIEDVFFPKKKQLSYYSTNLVDCFYQKKAKYAKTKAKKAKLGI